MKATSIFVEIPESHTRFVPRDVYVENNGAHSNTNAARFVWRETVDEKIVRLKFDLVRPIPVSKIGAYVSRIFCETLNNVAHAAFESAGEHDIVLIAHRVIAIGKQRRLSVQYMQAIKRDWMRNDLSFIGFECLFGQHETFAELFNANVYVEPEFEPEV